MVKSESEDHTAAYKYNHLDEACLDLKSNFYRKNPSGLLPPTSLCPDNVLGGVTLFLELFKANLVATEVT